MALGDLIYNAPLPSQIQFSIGSGFTSLPGQFVITGFGKGNFESGYFDATNNLNFTGTFATPEAFTAIYYNEADNSYWGITPYADTPFPQPTDIYLFHFKSDGTPILSVDITGILAPPSGNVSTAISLSPDGSEVLIAQFNTTEIYRFDTAGNYLGSVTFSPAGVPINGITTDGENLWICTARINSMDFTIYKTDPNFTILDSFSATLPDTTGGIEDIEFDKYNFAPKCAIVLKSGTDDFGNQFQFLTAYEVPCTGEQLCQEAPVIMAENQCLAVGDLFDPLANVTATDCDGSDIPVVAADVIFNDVDTSVEGMYTVTYEVTSPTNGKISTKTIYVGVVATGPRHQAITDIIQSVALEQTALGHIINAEGEKIQRAYALNLSNEDMLTINDSVADMTKAITTLEIVLQTKLGLFGDCLCGSKCEFPEQPII